MIPAGLITKAKKLFLIKAKYATTSAIATSIDVGIFLGLVNYGGLSRVTANIISYSCGMAVNFLLQKRFVFKLQRSTWSAFLLSALVSIGGLSLNTFLVWILSRIPMVGLYPLVPKLLATGVVFFYNFYLKRYVFEKRMFSVD
jgi:putative flippase GtrA